MTDDASRGSRLPPLKKAPAAWGAPLARFDAQWTRLEARLAAGVLIAEIVALCAWISLKGLSAEYQPGTAGEKNVSGLVFRGLVGAIVLGLVAFRATKGQVLAAKGPTEEAAAVKRQNLIVTAAVGLGLVSARLWANGGVEYFENFLNWLQSASLLMLIGGLRGVATRLTLWLALLGASLATANGKHINIDVVMRFLTPRMRVPVAVTGWLAAAVMCLAGTWGFFDHIAIALFHVQPFRPCSAEETAAAAAEKKPALCTTPANEKIDRVIDDMKTDWFVVRRQMSLDLRSFPRVVVGKAYNGYLTGAQWNTWVTEGDWTAHFARDQVSGLLVTPAQELIPHIPAVSIPGGQEVRGLLIKDADFVFPFGLFMIALRFLLRSVLAISGHVEVDPDSAHKEDDDEHPETVRSVGVEPPPSPAAPKAEV